MHDQANGLRELIERRRSTPVELPDPAPPAAGPCTVVVTSGKGGVGKSHVALNLAVALAEDGARACLVDANLGVGSIDLLCGLNGYWNLGHVVTGARRVDEILLQGPCGTTIVPGGSGLADLADCPADVQADILEQLQGLEQNHDFLVIDTGSGIHRTVRQFVDAAEIVLVLTTPEPTAITDAYATLKSLRGSDRQQIELLVNQADSDEARRVISGIQHTAYTFLDREVKSAGFVPFDAAVSRAVYTRVPFVVDAPRSAASLAIQRLSRRVKNLSRSRSPREPFFADLTRRFTSRAA